jgi:hypothetical protein
MRGSSSRTTNDFDRYLACEDAQAAELWELQTLLVLRCGIGRELSDSDYARLRIDLKRNFADQLD